MTYNIESLTKDADTVRAALIERGQTTEALDKALELDDERRRLWAERTQLKADRDALGPEIKERRIAGNSITDLLVKAAHFAVRARNIELRQSQVEQDLDDFLDHINRVLQFL